MNFIKYVMQSIALRSSANSRTLRNKHASSPWACAWLFEAIDEGSCCVACGPSLEIERFTGPTVIRYFYARILGQFPVLMFWLAWGPVSTYIDCFFSFFWFLLLDNFFFVLVPPKNPRTFVKTWKSFQKVIFLFALYKWSGSYGPACTYLVSVGGRRSDVQLVRIDQVVELQTQGKRSQVVPVAEELSV